MAVGDKVATLATAYPLSPIDVAQGDSHIMFVYFYQNRHCSNAFMPTEVLRQGFHVATQRYSVLLGTLQQVDGRAVLVRDDSRPNRPLFEEKSVDVKFSDVMHTEYAWSQWPEGLDTRDVVETAASKSTACAPLISVLLVRFRDNSGVSLRVKIRHSVLDGLGFTGFMSYWSKVTRQYRGPCNAVVDLADPRLEFDRSLLLRAAQYLPTAAHISNAVHSEKNAPIQDTVPFGMHVVRFSAHSLMRMRSDFGSETASVSVNDVLSVLLWRSFTRASLGSAQTRIMLACDVRKRIALSPHYMGNASLPLQLCIERNQLLGESLSKSAQLIRNRVSQVDVNYVRKCLQMLEHNKPILGADEWDASKSTFFCCTNCSRFGFYDTDFGCGTPDKVTIPHYLTPGFSIWLPTKDAGGIDVIISMLNSSFASFRVDKELLEYGQIIL
ncbi:hypothetical protein IWW38_000403 [Coemansia aciculifera]|uniref:Uncharacterized protein n=1 Tax=Coemansia aciculifera TaxID=417176 RepID=A0ACC1M9Z7_9FUNG|nr:hypothetical protein IWW38_000403 [Coemansia aciculifera]